MRRNSYEPIVPEFCHEEGRGYSRFPIHSCGGTFVAGWEPLLEHLVAALSGDRETIIAVDGVGGVDWPRWTALLSARLRCPVVDSAAFMRPDEVLERLVAPYMGGDDPLFGRCTTLTIDDFFDALPIDGQRDNGFRVVCGPGALVVAERRREVSRCRVVPVWVDLSRAEQQFRSRGGAPVTITPCDPRAPKEVYKRLYFVEWPMMQTHLLSWWDELAWYVDHRHHRPPDLRGGTDRTAGR